MPTFKEFFGIKPKPTEEETQLPKRRYGGTSPEDIATEQAEVADRRRKEVEKGKAEDAAKVAEIEKAKEKFKAEQYGEKYNLERRLGEIPAKLKELQDGLANMIGLEMRKILDREYDLNSKQSPIDSTDPSKAREYDDWVRALKISRDATQQMKKDLGARMDGYKKQISDLEKEAREIKSRIDRGY